MEQPIQDLRRSQSQQAGQFEEIEVQQAEECDPEIEPFLQTDPRVHRNGEASREIDASDLVVGDTIVLRLVNFVPADARLLGFTAIARRGSMIREKADGVNDAPALKKADFGIAVAVSKDFVHFEVFFISQTLREQLMLPGLQQTVLMSRASDGIRTSRQIFQRMRSYSLRGIASTFLIFFISIVVWSFSLPDILITLLAVLNDAATLVISVDTAIVSPRPDKWRFGQVLSWHACLSLSSWLHAFQFSTPRIQSIMYLQISSSPHFVIFSTRVPFTRFWKSLPSLLFTFVIVATQIEALMIAMFGAEAFGAASVGWGWGFAALAISGVTFMLLDAVKVWVVRMWSFELTAKLWTTPARCRLLAPRKELLKTRQLVRSWRSAALAVIFVEELRRRTRKQ
ncbi:hypothetical protein BJ742DRAFT_858473 [Cladochytrium replicatum]|nr:hypothetical protein BJ742DRAFT_858473 [Cladochytrium replicatum]